MAHRPANPQTITELTPNVTKPRPPPPLKILDGIFLTCGNSFVTMAIGSACFHRVFSEMSINFRRVE